MVAGGQQKPRPAVIILKPSGNDLMAKDNKKNDKKIHDLRDGRPGEDANTSALLAGHTQRYMPTVGTGEHMVTPLAGSSGGVAAGQVTKSN